MSGWVEIEKRHIFGKPGNDIHVSPLMQEQMCFVGQLDTYESGQKVIKKMLGIEVSKTQLYRVTDTVGKKLEKTVNEKRLLPPLAKNEYLYLEADGSMLLTREERWKEVKLGRIFKSGDCIRLDGKPSIIRRSQYVAHIGTHRDFINKIDLIIESFGSLKNRMIVISDGAPWIYQWVLDSYPDAIMVLDFFHVLEYLYGFAKAVFASEKEAHRWAKKQKDRLLKSQVEKVIQTITGFNARFPEEVKKIVNYYTTNQTRMDYAAYQKLGCGFIGSGAIESAHRTVVQKRMKLSGQRWAMEGAQNMLNLRVTEMNNQWEKVIEMVRPPILQAA